MTYIKKSFATLILTLVLFTWVTYPGFYHQWYYPYVEDYAYPAYITNLNDPQWGFWYY
jgi:hypothetical protein